MPCNDLGLWAFNSSTATDLCFSSLTINLYGEILQKGETLYSGVTSCNISSDIIAEGYYSNGTIVFRYQGGVRTPISCICEDDYCVNGTLTYDDTYSLVGIYDEEPIFSGDNSSNVIYYSSGTTQWCLSSSLGGSCLLFGPTGSFSNCPDLDSSLFYSGVCTTTTSTIDPCSTFDFDAIFDCLVTPTPSLTPTATPTPTPTPTPTTSNPCGGVFADVGGLKKTPLPSASQTPTPTPTPDVTRPCVYSGTVIFNTINEIMTCANSKKFKDCFTGLDYYTTQNLFDPSGNTLSQGYVYSTYINGIGICAVFDGLVENISGIDNVQIVDLVGPYDQGGCIDCIPPTPEPILECLVVNSECGNINVNPGSFINGKLSYTWTFPAYPQYTYQIYWDSLNGRWVCKELTTDLVGCYLNIDSDIPVGSILEWDYVNNINNSTSCIEEGAGFNTTLLSVPCPSPSPTPTPTPTPSPCVLYQYRITNNSISSKKFDYTNCEGNTAINIPMYSSVIICASVAPTTLSANIVIDPIGLC
jgi:hypothetical protein